MMKALLLCITTLCMYDLSVMASAQCDDIKPVYSIPGNATITVLFDAHEGINCTVPNDKGTLQMASALWLVDAINRMQILPGIHLGVTLYDTCSSDIMRQKILTEHLQNKECLTPYHLGIITTRQNDVLLRSKLTSVSITSDWGNFSFLIKLVISLLSALHKNTVDFILAPSVVLLDKFSESATESGICIYEDVLISENEERVWMTDLQISLRNRNYTSTALIILFCNPQLLAESLDVVSGLNISAHWIIVPVDSVIDEVSGILPPETLAMVIGLRKRIVTKFIKTMSDRIRFNTWNETNAPIASFENGLFLGVAFPILTILQKLQVAVAQYCQPDHSICEELPHFNKFSSLQMVDSTFSNLKKILSDEQDTNMNAVGYYGVYSVINGNFEEVGIFQNQNDTMQLSVAVSNNFSKPDSMEYYDCNGEIAEVNVSKCNRCANFARTYYSKILIWYNNLSWRSEAWVAAAVSISAVGISCCFSIGIFILVRMCKRDMLEGNPGFSLLLLIALICTYVSVLPYCFTVTDNHSGHGTLLCTLRILSVTLSYAFLFSIMVSRSLMLASCDKDGGFMSHINGYIQTVLCFFVVGVQVALSLQFFFINTSFVQYDNCSTMYEGYYFLILLAYDMFLLFLLVCISPFIIRSKRNYSEGMFFTFSAIVCLILWVTWCSAYMLIPFKWKDAAVVAGLTSMATTILIIVFIPRTYLIMSGVVRDHLASALPSLAYANNMSVQDLQYRINDSSQVLYDTVVQSSTGQVNPNFYSDQPPFPDPPTSTHDQENRNDKRKSTPENTYERYDSPPSPDKVTRF